MKIHCLVHLEFETLGNIREWACNKAYPVSITVPSENTVFPHPDEFDLLIIMGGLMSVYEEEDHPWLKNEKEFLKHVMDSNKAVYGICFGAQMISEVLGGKVSENKFKEIGWYQVHSLNAFNEINLLFDVPSKLKVLQWHGDTFTLPEGAKRLFQSEACCEQGFIYGDNVLALQFHPEVDAECVENLLENCSSDLIEGKYISSENEIRGRDDLLEASADFMYSILDWFENIIEKP